MREIRRRCNWGLYGILDKDISGKTHIETAQSLIGGGIRVLQLRDKTADFDNLLPIAHDLRALTLENNVKLIINDNPYLAKEVNADGVHLGQTDFPVYIARDIIGEEKLIGLSTHSKQQAIEAVGQGVDYIGVGPIYATSTKVSENVPVGTSLIRWIRQNLPLPIVAIGGITRSTIPDVISAGADNVAIISDLLSSEKLNETTEKFIRLIEQFKAD